MNVQPHTGLVAGIDEAVQACAAGKGALVVTVKTVYPEANLANTAIKVVFPDGPFETQTVTTDGDGIFTLVFEEMADDTLQDDTCRIQVADNNQDTDLFTLTFGELAKQQVKTALAYFGHIYELSLVYDRYQAAVIDSDLWKAETYILVHSGADEANLDEDPLDSTSTYRMLFTDIHSLKDPDEGEMLAAGADVTSKPADYLAQGWMPSTSPTSPFYVKVTKKRREAVVPITAEDRLQIRWKVTDTPPSFEQETAAAGGARTQEWLEAFYAQHVQADKEAWQGTVNCPVKFGGVRENDGGIKAKSVLFKRSDSTPLPEDPAAPLAARSTVEVGEGDLADHGVSKILFSPPPISGDKYVFHLSLVEGADAGNDVQVAHPTRGGEMVQDITTGPMTLWRRLPFRLAAKTPGVDQLTFIWDEIKTAYAAAYIEIPDAFDNEGELNEHTTAGDIRDEFSEADGGGWHDDYLLPQSVPDNYTSDAVFAHMPALTQTLISALTQHSDLKPNQDAHSSGYYMLYSKNLYETSGLLGQYVGKGQFFMVELSDHTCTFAHELGHALYLRHGLTAHRRKRKPAGGWVGAPTEVCMVVPVENFLDHDPKSVGSCLMSYTNAKHETDHPVDWHFCPVCLLRLRFWDGVKLCADAGFKKLIYDDLVPEASEILLVQNHHVEDCLNSKCKACEKLVPTDEITGEADTYLYVHALVQPDNRTNDLDYQYWQDVVDSPEAVWASDDDSIVAIDGDTKALKLHPRDVEATTRVTFTLNGVSAEVQVKVVPTVLTDAQKVHPRRLRITPQAPVGARVAQDVDELQFKGTEDKNWSVRFNGLQCWIAEGGDWTGDVATEGLIPLLSHNFSNDPQLTGVLGLGPPCRVTSQ